MAHCRTTVLTLGFTFNFFLLFTFMKHLQTYIRSDTSLLSVRRWKKIRPKESIYKRYLDRFFSSFFLSNVKSSPRAPQDQQRVWFCHHTMQYLGKALPSFLPMLPVQHGMRSNTTKKPHTQFTDVTSGWGFYISFERWQPHYPSFPFLIFHLQSP